MGGASRLIPLPSFLALALAGAHFWRAGWPSLAAACGLMAVLTWTRLAWVRQFLLLALPVLAARWIWTTAQFVQIRQLMEQPWMRLAVILLSVALFTAAAALLLLKDSAQQRYCHKEEAATAQMGAMAVCLALLLPVWFMNPQLLVLERFVPQGGLAQIMLAALWAVLAAGWLADRRKAPRARMRLWRLFSLVFFGQLVLGLVVESRFLLTGSLHLPVPGLIAAGPVYRGGGWFMLGLFGLSTLLVGAAWCSQLCYFGVWVATAAREAKNTPAPAWLPRLRMAALILTLATALGLRLTGAPTVAALSCGLLLGLLIVPCALLISRVRGYASYCRGICPLGLLAQWFGRISPWRIRRVGECNGCRACVRVCRQDAMTEQAFESGCPTTACHLCRDCANVCPRHALAVTWFGRASSAAWAGTALTALLAGLHAAFLFMARI